MILLVDDNEIQLNSRKIILTRAGFLVTAADSPEKALDIVRKELPRVDLIVTDHLMPGMDGVQFVTEVRKIAETLPVVVISGMPEVEAMYEGLGVFPLAKPCPPEKLIECVAERSLQPLSRTA